MKRVDVDGSRYYRDETSGLLRPSVTTIIEATRSDEDAQRLEDWRDRVGHDEAERIRSEAAARGTMLHEEIEAYLGGGGPGMSSWFRSVESLLGLVERVQAIELPVWSVHGFAGTLDCVAYRGEFLAVWDWKSARKPKRREYVHDYFLQLAAYSIAWDEQHEEPIDEGHVVVALEDAPGQHFCCPFDELSDYRAEFLARVETFHQQRNENDEQTSTDIP